MFEIKVGILVSYDYKYLYNSLPLVYQNADKIVLAIDKDRLTWSGLSYTIDKSFFNWLIQFDIQKKIILYEDTFYKPELTTMECDSRERTMLGTFMGKGGWHIQIDSDEYFINFKSFIDQLRKIENKFREDVTVYARWITLFKQTKNGFLFIDSNESFPVATTHPVYIAARVTDIKNKIIVNKKVIHQSWARSESEILDKINSWGHNRDFDPLSYYNMWKAIDENNYQYLHNFHPITPEVWPTLSYIDNLEIQDLIKHMAKTYIHYKPKSIYYKIIKNLLPHIIAKKLKLN